MRRLGLIPTERGLRRARTRSCERDVRDFMTRSGSAPFPRNTRAIKPRHPRGAARCGPATAMASAEFTFGSVPMRSTIPRIAAAARESASHLSPTGLPDLRLSALELAHAAARFVLNYGNQGPAARALRVRKNGGAFGPLMNDRKPPGIISPRNARRCGVAAVIRGRFAAMPAMLAATGPPAGRRARCFAVGVHRG